MVQVDLSFWAILVATILHYALGAVWYSPALFGKTWQALIGKTDAELREGAVRAYVASFFATLIMAYVMAHFVSYANATTLLQGATVGFWAWLGFVGTVGVIHTLYQNRPWKLFLIDAGYFLAGMIVMGAVLGIWR